MIQYILKDALIAEIEKRRSKNTRNKLNLGASFEDNYLLSFIDTLEPKEVDLNNGIQLTWEDIRDLYIIFAEIDAEIEFCKSDIQTETIGYYQEVLKRFKERKGE